MYADIYTSVGYNCCEAVYIFNFIRSASLDYCFEIYRASLYTYHFESKSIWRFRLLSQQLDQFTDVVRSMPQRQHYLFNSISYSSINDILCQQPPFLKNLLVC